MSMEFASAPPNRSSSSPRTNVWVSGRDRRIAIGDLVYTQWGVVVEYDGAVHQRTWERDIERSAELEDAGWRVVRVTNQQMRTPRVVVDRVYRKLEVGGYTGPSPAYTETWSELFEA